MGSRQLCQRSVCRCVRTLWGVGISFDIGIGWAAIMAMARRTAPLEYRSANKGRRS